LCRFIADKTEGNKSMDKKRKRSAIKAAMVQKTAEIAGVDTDTVYAVINGTRNNEEVMTTYMFLQDGENKLMQVVKSLVPFDQDRELVVCFQ